MRSRTHSRELALQYLYQLDLRGEGTEVLEDFLEDQGARGREGEFARRLVDGVRTRGPELDRAIVEVAEHWDLSRMAAVDRNVLRLGAWELLYGDDVPPAVVINEAVDLAKKFSSEDSGAFVNGLLDKIRSA